jgi:hypothetical protein
VIVPAACPNVRAKELKSGSWFEELFFFVIRACLASWKFKIRAVSIPDATILPVKIEDPAKRPGTSI